MAKEKQCFIIMPITTPAPLVPAYSDDPNHFKHVLNCLFEPAIINSGLKPVSPISEGSEVIQGKIIKALETCDLVLCDISALNPNVFFELGIRTALNKPVCLVKDNVTDSIPFDTSVTNHYTYNANLVPWNIDEQIAGLSQHLTKTIENCDNINSLWKYFAIDSIAQPYAGKDKSGDKLDYLINEVKSLKDITSIASRESHSVDQTSLSEKTIREFISILLKHGNVGSWKGLIKPNNLSLNDQADAVIEQLDRLATEMGMKDYTMRYDPKLSMIILYTSESIGSAYERLKARANGQGYRFDVKFGSPKPA